MCTGWCPLSADWGSVADWAMVYVAISSLFVSGLATVVAGAGAVAVYLLGIRANETTRDLKELEVKRDTLEGQSRNDERLLLLVSITEPVANALATISVLDRYVRNGGGYHLLSFDNTSAQFLAVLTTIKFTVPDPVRSRLHCLDRKVAAQILRFEQTLPTTIAMLKGISALVEEQRERRLSRIRRSIEIAIGDLNEVNDACQSACREAGLRFNPPLEIQLSESRP